MGKLHRSPANPAYPLDLAVQYAKELYAGLKRDLHAMVPRDVIYSNWALNSVSEGDARIAALKQYGLLFEQGQSDQKRLQLTALAKEICLEMTPEKTHLELLQEVALTPKIYRHLWNKFGHGQQHPSDEELEEELLMLNFNPKSTRKVISNFKRTVTYARLMDLLDLGLPPKIIKERLTATEEKVTEEKVTEEKVTEEKVTKEKVTEEKATEEKAMEEKAMTKNPKELPQKGGVAMPSIKATVTFHFPKGDISIPLKDQTELVDLLFAALHQVQPEIET